MNLELKILQAIQLSLQTLYGKNYLLDKIQIQQTKKTFQGDYTLVVFPFLKDSKKSPEETAKEIGDFLKENESIIDDYNVVKGFLNLSLVPTVWLDLLSAIDTQSTFGHQVVKEDAPLVMIEYSSPNTNKPLHLGHIRNNLLGFSLANIMTANGYQVVKTNIVNDRGIHICKSMLAWQKWGKGLTPEQANKKGDHLVGDFYVLFDQEYKKQIKELVEKGLTEEQAKLDAPLILEAQKMLKLWEDKDPEVLALWKKMNEWVYAGFDETYEKLGVDFDKVYYESDTYIVGRDEVNVGLKKDILYQREDGSVWADLSKDGLDEKLLLRADGTSVYMTQDIGTAKLRYEDFAIDKMIYVVGNEQIYHFQVLAVLLDKLGFSWGKDLFHFSYGMVELPDGKMKSREGTVVDADDLIEDMINTALKISKELGKIDLNSEAELKDSSTKIALGALKYFILKVDPKKNMIFNPEESIDFNGNTGPFIQYTYARIQSILRKAKEEGLKIENLEKQVNIAEKEISLVKLLSDYENVVKQAAIEYSPSVIANYVYELVKEYNQFYHDFSILREEDEKLKNFRLLLSTNIAKVIKSALTLLGIETIDRM